MICGDRVQGCHCRSRLDLPNAMPQSCRRCLPVYRRYPLFPLDFRKRDLIALRFILFLPHKMRTDTISKYVPTITCSLDH